MPDFPALGHVALSVTDLAVSVPFYESVIGAAPAIKLSDDTFSRQVFALPGGQLLGLTQHNGARSDDRFDVQKPGLDHVGFACSDRDELVAWQEHLDQVGVEHGGIVDAEYGAALSFKDPDGNALEFFAGA